MSSLTLVDDSLTGDRPANIPFAWRRSRTDRSWPTLREIDPLREGLTGVPGVVVVWSAIREGACIYTGQSRDLAAAMAMLLDDPAIVAHGGADLKVTWALIGVAHRSGVVIYLRRVLKPAVVRCSLDDCWPITAIARPLSVPLPT